MKIYGGKDYYDGAGYGIDNTIHFKRTPVVFDKHPFGDVISLDSNWKSKEKIDVFLFSIAVGNEVFPGAYTMYKSTNTHKVNGTELPYYQFFYDKQELLDHIKNADWEKTSYSFFPEMKNNKQKIENHFNTPIDKFSAWLLDNKIVVGTSSMYDEHDLCSETRMRKNVFVANHDMLAKFQFYKKFSAPEIHMMISRYVGGILPENKETIQLTDKSKIIKAGFDLKKSFRNVK